MKQHQIVSLLSIYHHFSIFIILFVQSFLYVIVLRPYALARFWSLSFNRSSLIPALHSTRLLATKRTIASEWTDFEGFSSECRPTPSISSEDNRESDNGCSRLHETRSFFRTSSPSCPSTHRFTSITLIFANLSRTGIRVLSKHNQVPQTMLSDTLHFQVSHKRSFDTLQY